MGTLILPDWNYPLTRRAITDADRWLNAHGFNTETEYRNARGELLADLLDKDPGCTRSGTVWERWTFTDGSAVQLGQSSWCATTRADN